MPDYSTAPVADLRACIAAHEADRTRAERKRAELAGARGEALVTLTVDEVLEFDADLTRTAIAIERADAHLARLRPALAAAAEAREAEMDARERATAERVAFAETRRAAVAACSDPEAARSVAQAALTANAPAVEYSPAIFADRPAPRVVHADRETWEREREARLRAEGQPTEALRR